MRSLFSKESVNVGDAERAASAAGGAALFAYGLKQRSAATPLLLFLGGLLLLRGLSGRCELYRRLGLSTARARSGVPGNKGFRVEKAIEIRRSPAQVFSYWRQLENLPKFMPHLRSVRETGPGRSHWIVKGPAGRPVEWDAEIINEHPGRMIAWQTLPGAEVQSAGTVRFNPLHGGRNTRVNVVLQYEPPAGGFGATVARIFGETPGRQLDQDLARFRDLVETDDDSATN